MGGLLRPHKQVFVKSSGALLVPIIPMGMAMAHGGGVSGGMTSGSGAGGPGMFALAGDGSLLVTEMGAGAMMDGPFPDVDRELINIGSDGSVGWRAAFEDVVPMMPVASGDLVIFALRDDWWLGTGPTGDTGFSRAERPGDAPGRGACRASSVPLPAAC